ncbi:MAG: NAD(P)H-dependent oxidoreductase [Gammaproteobacteria bacterium]|nr:NAD(P)H-dependent oxidoreductase [Gammaproteobacteria bacterium]
MFARGGRYRGTPLDTQTDYIRGILGLIGIGDVKTVFAEGLAMGEDSRHEGLEEARGAIARFSGRPEQEMRYANA